MFSMVSLLALLLVPAQVTTKVFAVFEPVTLNGLVDSHTSAHGVDRLEDFRVDWGGHWDVPV